MEENQLQISTYSERSAIFWTREENSRVEIFWGHENDHCFIVPKWVLRLESISKRGKRKKNERERERERREESIERKFLYK